MLGRGRYCLGHAASDPGYVRVESREVLCERRPSAPTRRTRPA